MLSGSCSTGCDLAQIEVHRHRANPVSTGPWTLLLLVAIVAGQGRAQDGAPRLRTTSLGSVAARSLVRVRTLDGGNALQGRLVSVDPVAIRLTTRTGQVLVLRRTIRLAEYQRGTRVLRGTLFGGAIGAVAGFGISYAFADYRSTDLSRAGLAGLVGTLSGLGGLAIGGAIGSTVPRWLRVQP